MVCDAELWRRSRVVAAYATNKSMPNSDRCLVLSFYLLPIRRET